MPQLAKSFGRQRGKLIPLTSEMAITHEINVIEDIQGLCDLRSEWNELAPPTEVEPWQSFNWMESAARAYSPNHRLRVITVRKSGRLTAIAPMVLKPSEQAMKPLQLHILGGEEMKEPNRLIACDNHSLNVLIDKLASEPVYPIRLSRIPDENGVVDLLRKKFIRNGWFTRVMSLPYPYIDLSGKKIRKSMRNDLRRARKKAQKIGKTQFDLVGGIDDEELAKYLTTAFEIEASGWKGRNNTAILSRDTRKKFFEHFAYSSLREGTLRLCFLLINGKPVAEQYAIESGNAYWLLNIGYDENVRSCSPGNLLLEASINHASDKGLIRYNLLGKEEPWTRRWTATTTDCILFAAYRPNLCGIKAMMSDAYSLLQRRWNVRKVQAIKNSRR
jgi:CelD/BcsL family acetyltransferase involved in cellulose biosynthesis